MEQNSAYFEARIKKSRINFLMAIVLSAVNMFLVAVNASLYFPFSASAPPLFTVIAIKALGEGGAVAAVLFAVFLGMALAVVGIYLLLYFLSKKHKAAMVLAAILFSLDTLLLVGISFLSGVADTSFLIDLAFHVWVLYYLFSCLKAYTALRLADGQAPVTFAPEQTVEAGIVEPAEEEALAPEQNG